LIFCGRRTATSSAKMKIVFVILQEMVSFVNSKWLVLRQAQGQAIKEITDGTRVPQAGVLARNQLHGTSAEGIQTRARKDAFLENVWHNKRVSLVGAA